MLAFACGQGAHLPSAWGPQVYPKGKAASNTPPAGLGTHLTRPAFSPETAAFRYCFHAIAFSFMSPMNAFPPAVLLGEEALRGGALPWPPTLEVLSAQTLESPVQVSTHGGWGCISCWPPSAHRPLGRAVGSHSQSPDSSVCSSGPRAGNMVKDLSVLSSMGAQNRPPAGLFSPPSWNWPAAL